MVNENAGTATITVNLMPASSSTVTVNYATSNGTAVSPTDYTATSGQLTFSPGQTSQTFSVPIVDEGITQGSKTVNLTLSSPINANLGSPSTATLTIMDNDMPKPTVQFATANYTVNEAAGGVAMMVNLSSSYSQTVTVHYATSPGTAVDGTDYRGTSGTLTFAPGQTSQGMAVTIIDKGAFSGQSVSFSINLSSPSNSTLGSPSSATVTIVDNDAIPSVGFNTDYYVVDENGGSVTVNVALSSAQQVPITVSYSTIDGAAVAGIDYSAVSGSLTFAAGVTSQTISVPIIDKGDFSGDLPDFAVQLTNPTPGNVSIINSPVTVYIYDDDAPPGPSVGFDASFYAVNESCGSVTINVVLSSAQQSSVTVDYGTSDNTALAGVDYVATSGTLTFPPGVTSQTITVPIIDKQDFSGNSVNFSIQLSNASPSSLYLTNSPAAVYILDHDIRMVGFGSSAYSTTETSGSVALTVTLNTPALVPITVDYATADNSALAGTDYIAASGTLTFSPGQTSQTITVNLINNGNTSGQTVSFLVTLSNPTANVYLGTSSAAVSILDTGSASPATVYFTTSGYAVSDGCGSAQIQVLMTGNPTGTVSVFCGTSTGGTAVAGVDYTATSGTLTWNATDAGKAQTFSVPILNDAAATGILTVNLTLSSPTNATLGMPPTAVIYILNPQVPCPTN